MNQNRQIIVQATDPRKQNEDKEYTELKQNQEPKSQTYYKLVSSICRCFPWKIKIRVNNDEVKYSPFAYKAPIPVPQQMGQQVGKKTLVLDLDETLVHSSFVSVPNSDLQFDLTLDGIKNVVFVKVRPGAIEFLKTLAEDFEIFIFTASISEYADPVIDFIDPNKIVSIRLYRENCTLHNNIYVKDLSKINRDLKKVIIVDNSPNSFIFQQENALRISDYYDNSDDNDLYYTLPFLKLIKNFQDIRPLHEWWNKFIRIENFTYINTRGQQIVFQLSESELRSDQGSNKFKDIQQEMNQSQEMNQGENLIVDQVLDSPKTQVTIKLIKNKNNKQQKNIILHKNVEFIQELDERLALNTDGIQFKQKKIESNSKTEDDSENDSIRNHLQINSPKDAIHNPMVFLDNDE